MVRWRISNDMRTDRLKKLLSSFPSHDDIDSEMCNANWADHTGFFITVPCSKCEQDVDINFEMTQEDFEVVN